MDNQRQATGDMKRELMYAWAAGFIDGDGSITILQNNVWHGGRGFYLRLEASGVSDKPLKKLLGLFGGTISGGYGRPIFGWRVDAGKARAALKAMLPYLTNKADQARLAIRFQNHIDRWEAWRRKPRGYHVKLPGRVINERYSMKLDLMRMHIRNGRQPAAATTESGEPAVAGK